MRIQSTPLTLIDQTDSRKLEVYIKSNLPTMQIYNQNTGAYTPNWTSGNKLVLTVDVFLDSRVMTANEYAQANIKWYKNDVEMTDGAVENISDDKRTLTINDNILKDNPIIIYACEATYQNITATSRVTFTRVDTGLNGETLSGRGVSAITERYLASDKNSGIATATDGWTTSVQTMTAEKCYLWNYETITYTDNTTTTTDPVIIGVYGATGASGKGIKSVIEYYLASSASSGVLTTTTGWTRAVQTISVDKQYLWNYEVITYTDDSFETTDPVIVGVHGGKGDKGDPGSAGRGVSSIQEQYYQSTSATEQKDGAWSASVPAWVDGKYIWTRSVITYTDNTSYTTTPVCVTGQRGRAGGDGSPGVGVSSVDVWYYQSTSATALSNGSWSTTAPTWADGKFVWTKTITTYTNNTTDETSAVCITGQKGASGTPAALVDITPSALYFKSTTGANGTFDPQYIYLYPRFQGTTYSNWQYSRDGGSTWASVSGVNGLTVNTYNSVANSLRIERTSTLYTDTITSISFKCNSSTSGVYDTVSIAKIYDVVDLQIGGRNLLLNSTFEGRSNYGVFSFSNGEMTLSNTSLGSVDSSLVTYTIPLTVSVPSDFRGKTLTFSMDYMVTSPITYGTTNPWVGVEFSVVRNATTGGSSQWMQWFGVKTMPTAQMNKWERKSVQWAVTDYDIERTLFTIHFRDVSGTVKFRNPKFEFGNTPTDYTPAPEDLIEEAANVNVMLSNEAHFFEATAGGVPVETSVALDVIGYKGSVKSATTVGTITGIPSAGMTATVSNNGTTSTKITINVTSALTSDIADYGILTIPITVNGHTINKLFNWTKAKAGDVGASGSDAVTFQVYSNNGYALSTEVPTLTLQTFAYIGDVEITAGATYQWYRHNSTDWVAVSGATGAYFNVSRDDVTFSNNYMCKMQFGGTEYVGVVTIDDKNDENKVFASKPSNYFAGDLWVVGTDYIPLGFSVGTMLRAEHTNKTYADTDWVPATKYDEEIDELKATVDTYKEYFSVNSTSGLQIGEASINNNTLEVGTINTSTVNAKGIESTMLKATTINIGNFSIIVESNGSLSMVANT